MAKKKKKNLMMAACCAAAALASNSQLHAIEVQWSSTDFDRWMYPFNGTPGTRATANTFGSFGNPDFDNRDAQFVLGFDTAGKGVPTGLDPDSYQITSIKLTATTSSIDTFTYDPTYDAQATYQVGANPPVTADGDAGRPIELYGIGFRGGYNELEFAAAPGTPGFAEGETFGSAPAFTGAKEDRFVFAADVSSGALRDVSNNVDNGFDTSPFAVGSSTLNPGDLVPAGTTFTFDIDVSDPFILDYLQNGLAEGQLGFALSSLHLASFGGAQSYPVFHTREGAVFNQAAVPVTLDIAYTIGTAGPAPSAIPEPASLAMIAAIGGFFATRRSRRRA